MKLKFIMSLCLAGASLGMFAQTHAEGVEYYKADQFNNALELLERNYNNPGTDKAIANYYLGLLNIKMKDMAKAAQAGRRILQESRKAQQERRLGRCCHSPCLL